MPRDLNNFQLRRDNWRFLGVMLLLFSGVVAGMLVHISHLQKNLVETAALHNAEIYVDALTAFRVIYSSEVVPIAEDHGMDVTHDYKERPHALPLPATLSMLLGAKIAEGASGASSRLYSPYPFSWRSDEGGLRDQFSQEAWQRLSQNPDEPVYLFSKQNGQEVFRYAVADRMEESCVDCHNGHLESPKRDWQVGDVRGVLEAVLPLDRIVLEAKKDLTMTLYSYIATALLMLIGVALLVIKQWRYSDTLEQHVAARTSELSAEIELREQFEKNLLASKEEAEQANRAKSEFLSHMSHELRTPLNAVIGFSQLLTLDDLTKDQKDSAQLIHSSGRHLLDLINDLLDLSQIEAGRMEIKVEPISLTALFKECEGLLAPLAKEKGIDLMVNYDPDTDYMVQGDYMRLKQVLINLINNAIKYNKENGRVTLYTDMAAGNRVRISVVDTGVGINEELQPRLFQPFDRLGAASQLEGTGIGLALSKRLIEMMEGGIGLTSKHGEGSTFWVELNQASVDDVLFEG